MKNSSNSFFSCLRSWFQRQQTCPTCRTPILRLTTPVAPPAAAQPANNQAGGQAPAPQPAGLSHANQAQRSQNGPAQNPVNNQPQQSNFNPTSPHLPSFNLFTQPQFGSQNMPLPPLGRNYNNKVLNKY